MSRQIKQKSIATCIVFSILTCGIYGLYWLAQMADDVNFITGKQNATSGGMVVLFSIITCNIYWLIWTYQAGDALDAVRGQNNVPSGNLGILYLLLSIFGLGIVTYALLQSEINKYATVE